MFRKIEKFVKEVKLELAKVTWTTKEELMASTIIVIVVSLMFSIFTGVVDLGLSNVVAMILR